MRTEVFFDEITSTLTYIVYDSEQKVGVVIDPVLDIDLATGRVHGTSMQKLIDFVEREQLVIEWILETHVHADHLSAAAVWKRKYPYTKVAVSRRITEVQSYFSAYFQMFESTTGSQFDCLLADGDQLVTGNLTIRALETPGHTPACMSYVFNEKSVFTGDLLFMPDSGTGRCDFPGGSAIDLYKSVTEKIYKLQGDMIMYVGHDYQPNGRELAYKTTVDAQKKNNSYIAESVSKKSFIEKRESRDACLASPKLLVPSLQVNTQAGNFVFKDSEEKFFLKIPLDFSEVL